MHTLRITPAAKEAVKLHLRLNGYNASIVVKDRSTVIELDIGPHHEFRALLKAGETVDLDYILNGLRCSASPEGVVTLETTDERSTIKIAPNELAKAGLQTIPKNRTNE